LYPLAIGLSSSHLGDDMKKCDDGGLSGRLRACRHFFYGLPGSHQHVAGLLVIGIVYYSAQTDFQGIRFLPDKIGLR